MGLIERYQRCAEKLWELFPKDPIGNSTAQSSIERLEAIIDRGLLVPWTGAMCDWPQCPNRCSKEWMAESGPVRRCKVHEHAWLCVLCGRASTETARVLGDARNGPFAHPECADAWQNLTPDLERKYRARVEQHEQCLTRILQLEDLVSERDSVAESLQRAIDDHMLVCREGKEQPDCAKSIMWAGARRPCRLKAHALGSHEADVGGGMVTWNYEETVIQAT